MEREPAAFLWDVPEHRQIVAFRNVLVHGYATLDKQVVWRVIRNDVPILLAATDALLARIGPPPPNEP